MTPGRVWNWKSALFSALSRAPIFFAVNLTAGPAAAVSAFRTEFIYRLVAAGFYGSLTQTFAGLDDRRRATTAAMVVVPAVAHLVEYAIHTAAGTPRAGAAVLVSAGISVLTTRLSLAVMRRGLFVTGADTRPLAGDLRELARVLGASRWRGPFRLRQPSPPA